MRISYITGTIVLSMIFGLHPFSFTKGETDDSRLKNIVVSIPPLKYIIENISGNSIAVYSLVNNTESPETYNISAKELFLLENADIYFSLGSADTYRFFLFEQSVLQTLQQKSSTVTVIPLASEVDLVSSYDTVENFSENEYIDHHYNETDNYTAYDNHIWLDTDILKTIARKVYVTLIQAYPINIKIYEKNYYDFLTKIKVTDKSLDILHTLKQKKILVVHPSLGYLAKKYSFAQVSLEWFGKERGIRDIISIENIIKESEITVLFTQPTINILFAKNIIQKFNLQTIQIDPLKEDILQNLLDISHALQMSIKK